MGNCLGSEAVSEKGRDAFAPAPQRGIGGKVHLQMTGSDFATQVSSAHFSASALQNTYSTIHNLGNNHELLITFFQGVGSPSALGEQHCCAKLASSLALQVFEENKTRYGESYNIQHVLRATLISLHHKLLASPQCSSSSSSGASAILVHLDLATARCTVANVGHSRCLLAGVTGSFNSKRPQTTWMSTLHTTANAKEKIHAARRGSFRLTAKDLIPLCSSTPTYGSLTTSHTTRDNTTEELLTRALGWEPRPLSPSQTTGGGSYEELEVDVATFDLLDTGSHVQHIVLGSDGFWALAAPYSVALRAHLFSQFQQAQKALVETAARDGAPVPSPAAFHRGPTAAEHLVYFALGLAADRLSKTTTVTSVSAYTVQDILNLPFERLQAFPVSTEEREEKEEKGEKEHSDGSAEQECNHQLIRSEVVGDIGCVVLTLQWPIPEDSQQVFANPPPRLFHPSATLNKTPEGASRFGTAPMAATATADALASDVAPLARFRWAQLRLLVDYHRQNRREVKKRWGEVVDGILKKAKKRAKAEAARVKVEHGIAVAVTPLMKVKAMNGEVLPAEAFDVRASINF